MQAWLGLRQELYRQLKVQVKHLLGPESIGLKKYRKEYDQTFQADWKPVSRNELLANIEQSKLVLLADFHALQQSQRSQLRILKSLPAKAKRILCLEAVEAKHQAKIDSYLGGKISEDDFLKSIAWQQNWGFPWEFYQPLFSWAKKHKISIRGLNYLTKTKSAASLRRRDQFAAKKISEILKQNPEHQLLVVFGDLHLARTHLPKSILQGNKNLKSSDICTVFQNSEKIHFEILAKNKEAEIEIVRLRGNQFCLLSVPPWVKWQSYLLYLESQYDKALDQDGLDFTDHLESYCQLLSKDLEIDFKSGSFSAYTAADDLIFEKLKENFSDIEQRWFEYLIEASRSFYIPEIKLAFLGRPSVNAAASLAMAILHAQISGEEKSLIKMPEDFTKLIFSEAIQYFGSKLINPKRKTDTVADIRSAFAARGSIREGRESLSLALAQKMKELMRLSSPGRKISFEMPPVRQKASYYEAARILGGMMGEKFYTGYRQQMISSGFMRKILKQSTQAAGFKEFYSEILEMVDSLPDSFKSKVERV